MGKNLAGMLHQYAQKFVLLGRQLYFPVADLDDTPHQVDGKIAGAENRTLAVRLQLVTQRRSHPREQFVHTEGLGDVVVGPEVESLNLSGLIAAAGEHHDRDALVPRAYHSQQFEALDIRKSEVENDQIRIARQKIKRRFAARRFQDLITLGAQ